VLHLYASQMAQNFWTAIYAFGVCFLVTVGVSLVTRPRPEQDLKGLVYSLTPRLHAAGERWYARPAVLGACVLAGAIVLNLIFR